VVTGCSFSDFSARHKSQDFTADFIDHAIAVRLCTSPSPLRLYMAEAAESVLMMDNDVVLDENCRPLADVTVEELCELLDGKGLSCLKQCIRDNQISGEILHYCDLV
jgi:hypothetical protein